MAEKKSVGQKFHDFVRGFIGKNSTWDHKNKGLPSPPQIEDIEQKSLGYQYDREFDNVFLRSDIWNWQEDGFNMFLALWFVTFGTYVGALFDYNDKMLDDLGLDKYKLEQMVVENGSLAVFIDDADGDPRAVALPFQSDTTDIYGNPENITIMQPNSERYKEKHLTPDQYEIFKGNDRGWNKIVENAPWLIMAYIAGCEYHDELTRGQKHFLVATDPLLNNNMDKFLEVINDFAKSRDNFLAVDLEQFKSEKGNPVNDTPQTAPIDMFSQMINELPFVDRTDTMFNAYQNNISEALKYLGIDVNMNKEKKERQITGEISVEAEIPRSQRKMMYDLRKTSIRRINKKFGLGWEVELARPETQATPAQQENKEEDEDDE